MTPQGSSAPPRQAPRPPDRANVTQPPEATAIAIEDLSLWYGSKQALTNVSLNMPNTFLLMKRLPRNARQCNDRPRDNVP